VPDEGYVASLFRSRLLRGFGVSCYSIYLFHTILMMKLNPIRAYLFDSLGLSHLPSEARFFLWFPVLALANWALGRGLLIVAERPSIAVGKRVVSWIQRRSSRQPEEIRLSA